MDALVQFWGVSTEGTPQKVSYSVPAYPIYWPTRPSHVLVRVLGEVSPELIEQAKALGWAYNPTTGTFYRED